MTEKDEQNSHRRYGLDRLLAITDGVFAFAITLLVLDLTVPTLTSGASSTDLWNALSKEYTTFLSYFLSFLIAGVWWTAHNRNFTHIREVDTRLTWLNLFFLLWIALLPFFTKILEAYNTIQLSVVLYALSQAAAGSLLTAIWWYASKNHRLIDKSLTSRAADFILIRNAIAPAFFILSIAASFINTQAGMYTWFGMIPISFLTRYLERGRVHDKGRETVGANSD